MHHGLDRLPKNHRKRTVACCFKRYEKQASIQRIQVEVKFLIAKDGRKIRRFHYSAIGEATCICALKNYKLHTQAHAIDWITYAIKKFPCWPHTIQTDNGHEFQAKFHWHLEDLGIRYIYMKLGTSRLNGTVERSYGTDKDNFYQMITYNNNVDLSKKIQE